MISALYKINCAASPAALYPRQSGSNNFLKIKTVTNKYQTSSFKIRAAAGRQVVQSPIRLHVKLCSAFEQSVS